MARAVGVRARPNKVGAQRRRGWTRVDWRTQQTIDEEWCDIQKVCAGTEPGAVADYLERRREVDKLYRHAAEQWKKGEEATFPVGTYPPGQAQPVEQLEPRAPPG